MRTNVNLWWEDALNAYEFLKSHDYKHISVIGHSMGGVFALRLAQQFSLSSVTTMCSPIHKRPIDDLKSRLIDYAEQLSTKNLSKIILNKLNRKWLSLLHLTFQY